MQFIEFSMSIYLDGRLWRARARFVFLGECRVFEVWLLFWGNLSRSLRRPRAARAPRCGPSPSSCRAAPFPKNLCEACGAAAFSYILHAYLAEACGK